MNNLNRFTRLRKQVESTDTFNDANYGDVAAANSNQVNGSDNVGVRAAGDVTVNRNITGAVGATSGTGNTVLGAGATYVESLDAGTISGAFDFGKSALTGSNALAGQFLTAFEKTQLKNAQLQSDLLAGFQGITESTNSTLRDALATTLKSDTLAEPAANSATLSAKSTERLVMIGAGLFVLWLVIPRRN